MPVIDVDLPLRSWTRNVPAEEALGLLDLAVPGRELPDWEAEAESTLSHEDRTYRRTLARLVGRMFLDVQDGIIQESRFLDLLADGPDRRRADLLAIRYALAHLWPLEAARRLVRPALLSGQDEVPIAAFDEFVRALIEEDASAASRRKTRSTVIGSLVSLGVAQRAAAATGPVTLLRGRPDPLAFGWALSEQLEGELRAECSAAWAVSLSDAAMLFGVTEDYGEACIRAAVAKGLLMGSEGTLALPR
ncbi:MAG: hypothetical protein VX000_02535 [Myxococcota bacterium]|nr:hypothetical protein [Myxococcota bacterium]